MEMLPDPPARFVVPGEFHACEAATRITRIYFRGGKHPTTWNALRHFGPTLSRFDHHLDPPCIQARGIFYATSGDDAFATALAEVFQTTRVIDLRRDDPWLAVFDFAASIRLLDTSGFWPVAAGGSMAINSGVRDTARAWSRAIYDSYPDAQGIWYPSSLTNGNCLAVYERAAPALPGTPVLSEALASPKLLAGILACATRINYMVR